MTTFDNEDKQEKRLEELYKKEEEELVRVLATKYGLNFIDLKPIPINTEALKLIPEEIAREAKIAAFTKVGKKVQVALFSPKNEKAVIVGVKDTGVVFLQFLDSIQLSLGTKVQMKNIFEKKIRK